MKSLIQFTAVLLFLGVQIFSARAGFTSLYAFGDGICTTTNNTSGLPYYYGKRFTNGRVWIEVLAQRQGLGASSISSTNWAYTSNSIAYYGQSSAILVTNVANFVAPANATNCLFVMWVNNADFVLDMGSFGQPPNGTNLTTWTTNINLHLTNQFRVITNLYAKGCRTLIAPNAADVTTVPFYNGSYSNYLTFVRQRIISYNTNFAGMLKQIQSSPSYPGLTIYSPDIFSLLNNIFTNAASYGMTNTLVSGQPMDAIEAVNYGFPAAVVNGYGTNYIFWGPFGDPTAKFHAVIADTVQQMISPVQFSGIASVNTSNRLDLVNVPVGMSGQVLFSTNLAQANWLTNSTFISVTNPQSIFVSPTNSARFYRLQFPWQWTWP